MVTLETAGFWTLRTRSPSGLITWGRRPATPSPMTLTAPSKAGELLWTLLSEPTSRSTIPMESALCVRASSTLIRPVVWSLKLYLFTPFSSDLWENHRRAANHHCVHRVPSVSTKKLLVCARKNCVIFLFVTFDMCNVWLDTHSYLFF